jgi:hypothetical protein
VLESAAGYFTQLADLDGSAPRAAGAQCGESARQRLHPLGARAKPFRLSERTGRAGKLAAGLFQSVERRLVAPERRGASAREEIAVRCRIVVAADPSGEVPAVEERQKRGAVIAQGRPLGERRGVVENPTHAAANLVDLRAGADRIGRGAPLARGRLGLRFDSSGEGDEPCVVATLRDVVDRARLAQPPHEACGREPVGLLPEPNELRAEERLDALDGETPLEQIVQREREPDRRSRGGRTPPPLAPRNAEPVEGGGQLLEHAASQIASDDGNSVGCGAQGEEVHAPLRRLARLGRGRGTGAEDDAIVAFRRPCPEQPAEEGRERRRLLGFGQLDLRRGVRAS